MTDMSWETAESTPLGTLFGGTSNGPHGEGFRGQH